MSQHCVFFALLATCFAPACASKKDNDGNSSCRSVPVSSGSYLADMKTPIVTIKYSFDPDANTLSGEAQDSIESWVWVLKFPNRDQFIADKIPGIRFTEMTLHNYMRGTSPSSAAGFSSRSLKVSPGYKDGLLVSYTAERHDDTVEKTTPGCTPFDSGCLKTGEVDYKEEAVITSWNEDGFPTAGTSTLYKDGQVEGASTMSVTMDQGGGTASLVETICTPECRESSGSVSFDSNGNMIHSKLSYIKHTGNILRYRFPEAYSFLGRQQVDEAQDICLK